MQQWLAGADEAGRGPLVGEVVAAAVILDPNQIIQGLNDSKKLTEKKREALYTEIIHKAKAYHIASASVEEIDRLNILHASMLAMKRAIEGLPFKATHAQVDGNRCPDLNIPCEAIIKGDGLIAEISAASILAKVHRDRQMVELDKQYPEYGFAKHKGYPTQFHREILEKIGPTPFHRKSFGPVQRLLDL